MLVIDSIVSQSSGETFYSMQGANIILSDFNLIHESDTSILLSSYKLAMWQLGIMTSLFSRPKTWMILSPTLSMRRPPLHGTRHSISVPFSAFSTDENEVAFVPNPVSGTATK